MGEVKNPRRRGYSRVSAKHQVTLPVDALGEAEALQAECAITTDTGWPRDLRIAVDVL